MIPGVGKPDPLSGDGKGMGLFLDVEAFGRFHLKGVILRVIHIHIDEVSFAVF